MFIFLCISATPAAVPTVVKAEPVAVKPESDESDESSDEEVDSSDDDDADLKVSFCTLPHDLFVS